MLAIRSVIKIEKASLSRHDNLGRKARTWLAREASQFLLKPLDELIAGNAFGQVGVSMSYSQKF